MKRLAVLLPVFLAACITKYQLPSDAPSATITLRTFHFRPMDKVRVQVYGDDKCTKSASGTRLAYFFMDMYDSKANGVVEAIAADRDFVFTYVLNDGGECAVTSKFRPAQDGRYHSYFSSARDRKCFVTLEEEYTDESGKTSMRPVSSFVTVNKACVNNLTD